MTAPQYRKRFVIVTAEQCPSNQPDIEMEDDAGTLWVVVPGDWILTYDDGSKFVCKEEFFAAEYEKIPLTECEHHNSGFAIGESKETCSDCGMFKTEQHGEWQRAEDDAS